MTEPLSQRLKRKDQRGSQDTVREEDPLPKDVYSAPQETESLSAWKAQSAEDLPKVPQEIPKAETVKDPQDLPEKEDLLTFRRVRAHTP